MNCENARHVQKNTWKQRRFFGHPNYIAKSTWKQRGIFDHRNYTDKSTWKQQGFFEHRNYIEKSTWKQRGFFDHRNYIEKITWKRSGFLDHRDYIEKVCGNDVEIRRNLVFDVSTWIRRGVPVGLKIRVRIILCNLYTFSSSSLTSVFNLGITWFNKRKIK